MILVPQSWGEFGALVGVLSALLGGIFWLVRRVVMNELSSWRSEMLQVMDKHYKEIEGKFVEKQILGLELKVFTIQLENLTKTVETLKVMLEKRNDY